jgi:hypothetical protein
MAPGDVLEALDASKCSGFTGLQVQVFETPYLLVGQRHDTRLCLAY